MNTISDKILLRDLMVFVRDLYNFDVSDRLMLFRDMIDENLSGRSLHFLFAFLRAALVSCSNKPLSALCQPISRSKQRGKEFPLHSDLYIPVVLFNIFDDVENDASGASIFLSVSATIELLDDIKQLPPEIKQKITQNLTHMHNRDRYEETYELMHGWGNAWTQDIERRMRQQQLRIKLYSGQGYMLHDRKWLHGREPIAGNLSQKRLHRLIFNTRKIQRAFEKLVG